MSCGSEGRGSEGVAVRGVSVRGVAAGEGAMRNEGG